MLAEAQALLEARFVRLSSERTSCGYPVYVLEHALEPTQVETIRQILCQKRQLDKSFWLLWIVVATEIGYSYDGEEFWRSFEEAIPGWRQFGDRKIIRRWFNEFAKRYGGFTPVGKWASHFSIIAWPITHAILPRDLQGQFAKRIYDLRYRLAAQRNVTTTNLGAILQTDETGGTSRFQHFLGQTELVGRLVLALRDDDVEGTVAAICPPTLSRIVADLERRRSAGDWLRDARRVLRDARLQSNANLIPRVSSAPRRITVESEFDPGTRLIARQTSDGSWLLGLKLPDFAQMLERAGTSHSALDKTRIRFNGRPGGPMPGRALLSLSGSEQRIASVRSDKIAVPIIVFERDVDGLSNLLTSALRVKGASAWLLRIQDDGVARQTLGNFVRTGQSYLIVSEGPLSPGCVQQLSLLPVATGECDAAIYALNVPNFLSVPALRALESIRIGYTLRVNVEPVGLVPRWDNSADCTTWLTTEELILRLRADHPVREFLLKIDQAPVVRITSGTTPNVLVSLGQLAAGSYLVEVSAITSASSGSILEPGRFAITVRPPAPWTEGVRDRAGFRVALEPPGSTLNEVFSGKARTLILGPSERPVAINARLFNLNGHMTEEIRLGTVPSLADEAAVGRFIRKLNTEPFEERINAAPRVDLRFAVDELGQSVLSFPQRVGPLRWRLSREGTGFCVRLIDEAGADHPIMIMSYMIAEPDRRLPQDTDLCMVGMAVGPPGALFTASLDGKLYSAIVSVLPRHKLTLSDLRVAVTVSASNNLPKDIPRLLSRLRLWNGAKQILGPFGNLRKNDVCIALEQRIALILCGERWANLSAQCHSLNAADIDRLRQEVGGSVGFGARLRSTDWSGAPNDARLQDEFARLASVYHISNDASLSALALQVAFAPAAIRPPLSDNGAVIWDRLSQVQALSRGAFFARFVADSSRGARL